MQTKALMIFLTSKPIIDKLSDEEAGQVLKSLLKNLSYGSEPLPMSEKAEMAYLILLETASRQIEAFEESNRRRSATQKRNWANKKGNATEVEATEPQTIEPNPLPTESAFDESDLSNVSEF